MKGQAEARRAKDRRHGTSPADVPGSRLRGGDLVLQINDTPVKTAKGFEELMAKVAKARPRIVKLFVRRRHRTNFVFIEPDWPSGSSD